MDRIQNKVPSITKENLTITPNKFFSIIMIFIILIIINNNGHDGVNIRFSYTNAIFEVNWVKVSLLSHFNLLCTNVMIIS